VDAQQPLPFPILDTHIHLFDPTHPQGVPWPPKTAVMYRTTLPDRLREVTQGLGVKGAIEVECSPWLEDNQWVLDVAAKDPIIVGMIGNLEPGKAGFREQLDRLRKNPLFLGIRYGYLWGRNLGEQLNRPEFVADLKALADAGLTLDTANASVKLLGDVRRITDLVPRLRVVIDHLAGLAKPSDAAQLDTYQSLMRDLGHRKKVFVKVSAVLRRVDDKVNYDLAPYRAKLDELSETFGPDRVLYGSDWPNSEPLGTYPQVLGVVREYFLGKGKKDAAKYFYKNSIAAYRWKPR